jgi:hypothetical protein
VNSKHRGRKNIHRDSKHEAFVDLILCDFDSIDPVDFDSIDPVDVYRPVYQDWVRRMRRQPKADDNIFPEWSKVKAPLWSSIFPAMSWAWSSDGTVSEPAKRRTAYVG